MDLSLEVRLGDTERLLSPVPTDLHELSRSVRSLFDLPASLNIGFQVRDTDFRTPNSACNKLFTKYGFFWVTTVDWRRRRSYYSLIRQGTARSFGRIALSDWRLILPQNPSGTNLSVCSKWTLHTKRNHYLWSLLLVRNVLYLSL